MMTTKFEPAPQFTVVRGKAVESTPQFIVVSEEVVEPAPQFIVVTEETPLSLYLSTASAVLKKPLKRFYDGGGKCPHKHHDKSWCWLKLR